jgi:HEAT repeat protein
MMPKCTVGSFLKAIRMSTKQLYLIMFLLVIGCQQAGVSQSEPVLPTDEASTKAELDPQLKIIREALFKGSTEAATVLLFNKDPQARKFLLEALKQTETNSARVAVCKALIQTRTTQKIVENKEEFIQPLLEIFTTDDTAGARLAAEATLIFKYEQIKESLERIATDASLPAKARLNAIYALRLHPDMAAVLKLIELLEDPESQVAAAAASALSSIGIPIGDSTKARKEIINELERQGPEAFLRDRLLRKETEIRRLETELNSWRERYRTALDKIYLALSDDAVRSQFLVENLRDPEMIIRLWALEKVRQDRVGTRPNPKLPGEVGPILANLISDQNRDVRLKTAQLLSLMGGVIPAQSLLTRLEVEQDDEVKMELFVALGYAFSPNPKTKIPDDVRKQALDWAVKFLGEQNPKQAQKGAEVMKRLLEQNGLASPEAEKYLGYLAEKFNQQDKDTNGSLRGELLSIVAGLCAPQSAQNVLARKLFRPLFEKSLSDRTDLVREAAVDGLIYIDKAGALKILRNNFVNDPSAIVRRKLIDLAGEVGAKEDLGWLVEKIGSSPEGKTAWQAMLKIFDGSDTSVLSEWIDKFFSQDSQIKLSDDQKIAFLEIADRKIGENKPEVLKNVREMLAGLYIEMGQFERAADYLSRLHKAAQTEEEKETILSKLVNVYLRWSKVDRAAKLVENCLLQKDLDSDNKVVRSIDEYLISVPEGGVDPNTVLEALGAIKIDTLQVRPKWRKQMKRWTDRLSKAADVEKPEDSVD